MFGESEDTVTLALVEAVLEKVVQEEPPFRLYCHISAVLDEVAEILNPLAVTPLVLKATVGVLRSILSRLTVVEAVIVPTDTPEYVPENLHDADSATPVLVPSELWLTRTVFVFNSTLCQLVELMSLIAGVV